jgi:hypothetical protein
VKRALLYMIFGVVEKLKPIVAKVDGGVDHETLYE